MTACAPMHPLVKAAHHGDAVKVTELLKAEPNPDSAAKQAAFLDAVKQGHVNIARALLAAGANLHERGIVEYRGAEVRGYYNDVNCECNALDLASASGKLDMVNFLVAQGSVVNEIGPGGSALTHASYVGHIEVMKFLVTNGADTNAAAPTGETPLMAAAHLFSGVEATVFLLKHGARIDAQANDGKTALRYAVFEQRKDVVKVLLDHGANTDLKFSADGDKTALMLAWERWSDKDAEELSRQIQARQVAAAAIRSNKSGAPLPSPAVTASAGVSREELTQMLASAVKSAQVPAPAGGITSFPGSPAPRFAVPERPSDLAIIVGIESYSDIASKAPYAERDADAFKAYIRALGVPERNVVLLKGSKAVRSALTKNVEGWLPRMAKADSRVYFYFSGHGAPDVKTGQAYLVPWDGDPNFLESTAYPVAQLYKKLGELPVKQVLVAMDSCFSGAGGRSVLASGARPLVSKIDTGVAASKITVLAASGASEISGSLDDKGHGAFTYFLLEGLNAGKTTPRTLSEYLTPRVQDEARRLNRDQTPQLQGGGDWPLR